MSRSRAEKVDHRLPAAFLHEKLKAGFRFLSLKFTNHARGCIFNVVQIGELPHRNESSPFFDGFARADILCQTKIALLADECSLVASPAETRWLRQALRRRPGRRQTSGRTEKIEHSRGRPSEAPSFVGKGILHKSRSPRSGLGGCGLRDPKRPQTLWDCPRTIGSTGGFVVNLCGFTTSGDRGRAAPAICCSHSAGDIIDHKHPTFLLRVALRPHDDNHFGVEEPGGGLWSLLRCRSGGKGLRSDCRLLGDGLRKRRRRNRSRRGAAEAWIAAGEPRCGGGSWRIPCRRPSGGIAFVNRRLSDAVQLPVNRWQCCVSASSSLALAALQTPTR